MGMQFQFPIGGKLLDFSYSEIDYKWFLKAAHPTQLLTSCKLHSVGRVIKKYLGPNILFLQIVFQLKDMYVKAPGF